ncbi:hypothetical protein MRX96_027680 [Rhipicephalus microplus]
MTTGFQVQFYRGVCTSSVRYSPERGSDLPVARPRKCQSPGSLIRQHPATTSHDAELQLKHGDVIVLRAKRTGSLPSAFQRYPRGAGIYHKKAEVWPKAPPDTSSDAEDRLVSVLHTSAVGMVPTTSCPAPAS